MTQRRMLANASLRVPPVTGQHISTMSAASQRCLQRDCRMSQPSLGWPTSSSTTSLTDLMVTLCGPTDNAVIADEGNAIEIGAEVFAAEFIHSEADFVRDLEKIGTPSDPKALVRLKEATSTSLSYRRWRSGRSGSACSTTQMSSASKACVGDYSKKGFSVAD
jgi:hypothetical protein